MQLLISSVVSLSAMIKLFKGTRDTFREVTLSKLFISPFEKGSTL